MSASHAFQTWAYGVLRADADLKAMTPRPAIFDADARPEIMPAIRLGEGQDVPADDVVGRYFTCYLDAHVWTAPGDGLALAKQIGGIAAMALRRPQVRTVLDAAGQYVAIDIRPSSGRYFRDADQFGHGVVTIQATVQGP